MFRSKNSQASPEPKNSRHTHAAKNSPTTPDGRTDREPRTDGRPDDAPSEPGSPDAGQSIEDMRQQLDEFNRRRRRMIARGVAVVILPPVLLCVPFIILKACKLLLIPWGWTFAPLLLLLVPLSFVFRAYFAAVRAFRAQPDDQPDNRTEGDK